MPKRDDAYYRKHTEAIIEKLMRSGWIDASGFHDASGKYGFKWTPKGFERSRWVKEIATELNLGPEGMCALLVVCELHASDPESGQAR